MSAAEQSSKRLPALMVGAMGVVYGDIGTSPLYTIRECFSGSHGVLPTQANIFGVMSMIFWSLILVVTCKYVLFILRADNRGEGGVLALLALTQRTNPSARLRYLLMVIAIMGTSLFYGDSLITPAISVLSAVEGVSIAAPALNHFVIPICLCVLLVLFFLQKRGTASVGNLFGPVMLLWFSVLGVFGALSVLQTPDVLQALNPWYALQFAIVQKWHAFVIMSAVVLAITGAETLYADMGHFGRKPIQYAWLLMVLPALLLNYFGQCALLLRDPSAVSNPFYLLAPGWALYPLIILATAAAVIASQAVISGAFSLTRQAIQLGYLPRMEILHTSDDTIGQIYIPLVNWLLLVCIMLLVVGFGSSANLASAYGIAVTGAMIASTLLMFIVLRKHWHWPLLPSASLCGVFLLIDAAFFSSATLKIEQGGWFPLLLGGFIYLIMSTWKRGKALLLERMEPVMIPLQDFLDNISAYPPQRVEGSAVFMTGTTKGVPPALLHNLKHNKVLHERIILLTVVTEDIPLVSEQKRLDITPMENNFFQMIAHYGFKEDPDIPKLLECCISNQHFDLDMMDTSFFLSKETLIPTDAPGMSRWRESLFVWMARNAMRATDFFRIPTNRVVELGTQIEL